MQVCCCGTKHFPGGIDTPLNMEQEEEDPDDIFMLGDDDTDEDEEDHKPQAFDPADATTFAGESTYPSQEQVPGGSSGRGEVDEAERGMGSDPYNPDDWDDVLDGEEVEDPAEARRDKSTAI